MTVASAISRVSYAGNGSTTAFSVPYYFLENGHLQVILSVSGVNTVQTITTNYTVTGAGNPAGGTVTMLVAPAAGTQLTIVRDVPATQETDYTANDPFPAESHERALDKLTMLVQENDVRIARAVRGPVTDSDAINMILPAAVDRADGILQFDTNGAVDVVSTDQFIAGLSGAIIGANYVTVSAVGNGSTTAFTVSPAPGAKGNIQIYLDGVYQNKATFSLSGTTVTFTEAPPLNSQIEFVIGDALLSTAGNATGIDFTQQGTGAITRTVANKLYESVSVKDFGATGDGVTDDTVAIQAALTSLSGGGQLIFPSGTYLVSGQLTIAGSDLIVSGNGDATIKLKNGNYSGLANLYMFFGAEDMDNIHFDNLIFDGNRANVTASTGSNAIVWLYRTRYSSITNCIVKNPYGGGSNVNAPFCFIDSSFDNICNDNTIYADTLDPSFGACGGIFMQGGNSIASNNIIRNMNDVVIVANGPGSFNFVFSNNFIQSCRGGGIVAENGANQVTISGNTISNLDGYGIAALWLGTPGANSTNVAVVGNTINYTIAVPTSVINGIAMLTADYYTVSGNTIGGIGTSNVNNAGIVARKTYGSITGNTIISPPRAILIDGGATNMNVSGNTIQAATNGIVLDGTIDNIQISDNHIVGVVQGIARTGGATVTDLVLTNNFIDASSKEYAIGNTNVITLKVLNSTKDVFMGTFSLAAPTTVTAGSSANVNLDIGSVTYAGGPFNTTANVSWVDANVEEGQIICSFDSWASAGVTAVITCHNMSGGDIDVQDFNWVAYGKIANYQK